MKKKKLPKPKKIQRANTISIQKRIYPELVDKLVREASKYDPPITPTKLAAGILCKNLELQEPVRKNAAQKE